MSTGAGSPTGLTASVVIITMCRPDFVRTCLQHLDAQTVAPLETIVVDASPDEDTARLLADEYPQVSLIRIPGVSGAMATSRNLGLQQARGDVVVFLDDDAFAEKDWLEHMLEPFADDQVGAVGGRVLRGPPPEDVDPADIGRMRPDGTLSGLFDADPGRVLEVDHIQGANMAYRRTLLESMGGIRDGYPGTCVREETDLCLRVRAAGAKLLFTPFAVVDHVAAPYTKGKRFDLRYDYFSQRNHLVLLVRHFGVRDPIMRRYLASSVRTAGRKLVNPVRAHRAGDLELSGAARQVARAAAGAGVTLAGTAAGLVAGGAERRKDGAPSAR